MQKKTWGLAFQNCSESTQKMRVLLEIEKSWKQVGESFLVTI